MSQDEHDWRQRVDCVRPGHRDEDLEVDLSELPPTADQALQRSEQWDRHVQSALHKTQVPADLAARLEAALDAHWDAIDGAAMETVKESHADPGSTTSEVPSAHPTHPTHPTPSAHPTPPSRGYQLQRRWWIVAAALLIACSVLPWMGGLRELPGGQLVQRASEWAEQWQRQDSQFAWVQKLPPSHRPLAATIDMPLDSLAWRTAELLGDTQAVVYRSGATTLAVIKASHVTQLGAVPPNEPQFQTGRRRIGAWAQDGLVFVLIVDGDLARYQSVLQRPFDA